MITLSLSLHLFSDGSCWSLGNTKNTQRPQTQATCICEQPCLFWAPQVANTGIASSLFQSKDRLNCSFAHSDLNISFILLQWPP